MPSGVTDRFADDLGFLKSQGEVLVLSDASGAKVAVMPALQGRVMTSTTGGGDSFGWINRSYFAESKAGKVNPHISPFGGEDRFWIGPEGGQFSIFFKKGDSFDFANWKTPAAIDTEPFETLRASADSIQFTRTARLANWSGTVFDIRIDREIRLLNAANVLRDLNAPAGSNLRVVAFESDNRITNLGAAWSKQTGLLSIWILGMLNASPQTTVAIPVRSGDESQLGPKVNDEYFGKISRDRLKVQWDTIFYKADATSRGKIGVSPARTKPIAGSYSADTNVLTLVGFTYNPAAKDYVNSEWKHQEHPYAGDVVNSYNDGPPPDGKPQMGKFYELETSSAAYELKTGESMQHVHRTIHLTGERSELDAVARATLGAGLDQISGAFAR